MVGWTDRARDEDDLDVAMTTRTSRVRCKGCNLAALHPVKLECGHVVCMHCLERNEVRLDGVITYDCVTPRVSSQQQQNQNMDQSAQLLEKSETKLKRN